MKQKQFRKPLVGIVIFLFLTIAVKPITSINLSQDTIIKDSNVFEEEDCIECNLKETNEIKIEKLLNRIEDSTEKIYRLSNDFPEIRKKCVEILDIIYSYNNDGPICSFLNDTAFILFNKS